MYTVAEIINQFSPSNPHFFSLMIGYSLANLIGLLEYFWAVALTIKEKKGPFPTWMHTFFLAHDSTAAIVFTILAVQHQFFWVFSVYAIGMYTWTIMEIFCLFMDVKYTRQESFGTDQQTGVTTTSAITKIIMQVVIMYCIINGLRYFMQDQAMFIWLPLTNFIMAIGPGYLLRQRQSRAGSSVLIYLFIVLGTLLNFAPKGIGFFSSILPQLFNRPIWFIIGLVALIIAVINLIQILRFPSKTTSRSIW